MITMEQVDEFRKRTNSSYEDAKYFLERNNGDVLDAIIDFERSKTGRSGYRDGYRSHAYNWQGSRPQHHNGQGFSNILQKGFDTRIVVEDNKSVLFSIPVIFLLFMLPLWILVVVLFVFFIMLGYRVSIRDMKSGNADVNAFFSNISEKMREKNQPAGRPPMPPEPKKNGEQDKKDGYKEYTIE
ncbi:MAG TPA: hypothetical protein PK369_04365 [Thermoclostridium sp.]|nr:hypothetical protein [Clostridiaceae bacterium]HOQ75788.1 hypothetical protein [Thermoclostridium sp.]HPU45433.1 hypothetical protein [Thermoclostridium sp.]